MEPITVGAYYFHTACRCGGEYVRRGGFARRTAPDGTLHIIAYFGPQCGRCNDRYGGEALQQEWAWIAWDRQVRWTANAQSVTPKPMQRVS